MAEKKETPEKETAEKKETPEKGTPTGDLNEIVKRLAGELKNQSTEIELLKKELAKTERGLKSEIEGLSADVLESSQQAKKAVETNTAQGERLAIVEGQLNKVGPALKGIKARIEQADDLNPKTRGYLMAHSKSNPSTVIPVQFDCSYAEARERAINDEEGNNYFFWPFVEAE